MSGTDGGAADTSASGKAQQEKKADSSPKSERADLTRFRLDDRSQAGFTDIWVVWTVKNTSGKKSDYRIDWEAVDSHGIRVANSTEFVTDVQPGQTTTGESPTTLHSAQGVKLNITSFDRTAAY
ncbi:lipoprotein [Streptomyces griseoflavus]|nr:lipoprotein [Streptomyces griseoflavus]